MLRKRRTYKAAAQRLLTLLLACAMTTSSLPLSALAADEAANSEKATSAQVVGATELADDAGGEAAAADANAAEVSEPDETKVIAASDEGDDTADDTTANMVGSVTSLGSSGNYVPAAGASAQSSESLVSALSSSTTNVVNAIKNGSFEDPNIGTSQFRQTWGSIPSWSTTDTNTNFELVSVANGAPPHMVTGDARAYEGNQFAELNFNDGTTQYQTVSTNPKETYTWSFAHRAMYKAGDPGYDKMAVIIGDYPGAEPTQTWDSYYWENKDQFMYMVDWLKSTLPSDKMPDKNSANSGSNGCWGDYEFWSAPFAEGGGFEGGLNSSQAFSMSEDATHSIRWTVRFVCSDEDAWYAYKGSFAAHSDKTMIAMTNFLVHSGRAGDGNLIDAVSLVSNATGDELIVNGGYECSQAYQSNWTSFNTANSSNPTAGVGWSTTESTKRITVGNQYQGNTGYIKHNDPNIRVPAGTQCAELDAEQESTLYQKVTTKEGTRYDWGLYHRGRSGIDTMAVVIGPTQGYDPKKTSSTADDQYNQMVKWVTAQKNIDFGFDVVNYSETGISKKIVLYSAPFNNAGGFDQQGASSAFSWTADAQHTQKWEMWIMASDAMDWAPYGSAEQLTDGIAPQGDDCYYIVPNGQEATTFAFVSVHSAAGSLSVGNLLDDVVFATSYRVDCAAATGGSGSYTSSAATAGQNFSSSSFISNYVPAGGQFSVVAKPDADRKFVGGYINGEFYPAVVSSGESAWTENSDGTYTYTVDDIEQLYSITLIFNAKDVIYDSNGGDAYHYEKGDTSKGNEVPLKDYPSGYTSHGATASQHESKTDGSLWKFMGWLYAKAGIVYGAEHTVKMENNLISIADGVHKDSTGISNSEGVTFIAQWTYQQRFTTQAYVNGGYEDADYPGKVVVTSTTQQKFTDGLVTEPSEDGATTTAYVDDDTTLTATAIASAGYTFTGWYTYNEVAGHFTLVTSSPTYEYAVTSRSSTHLYAHFDPEGANLSFSKTVAGSGGDTSKYFRVTVSVTGAKAKTSYLVTGGTTTAIALENQSFTNPAVLTTDANGASTTVFYIKHGETISVLNLPAGTSYTVAEANYSEENYSTTVNGEAGLEKTGSFSAAATAADDDDAATDAESATVNFVNTREGAALTLRKISATGTDYRLAGAEFTLTRYVDGPTKTYSVTTNDNGEHKFDFLPTGSYTVEETTAPAGYELLGTDQNAFTVVVGDNTVSAGTNTVDQNAYWSLAGTATGGMVLTVKNDVSYTLPTTGGPGVVPFAVIGTALMAVAAWLASRIRDRGGGCP